MHVGYIHEIRKDGVAGGREEYAPFVSFVFHENNKFKSFART